MLSFKYEMSLSVSNVPVPRLPAPITASIISWLIIGIDACEFIPAPAVNLALANNGIFNLNNFFWRVKYPEPAVQPNCFLSIVVV